MMADLIKMTGNLVKRCPVCETIEFGKNVLIPRGRYQLIIKDFNDVILSRECLRVKYEGQLSQVQMMKMLADESLYDSCRHHE